MNTPEYVILESVYKDRFDEAFKGGVVLKT